MEHTENDFKILIQSVIEQFNHLTNSLMIPEKISILTEMITERVKTEVNKINTVEKAA